VNECDIQSWMIHRMGKEHAAVLAQKIMEEHAAGRVQIPHRSGIGTTIQSLANWIGVTPTSKFAIQ